MDHRNIRVWRIVKDILRREGPVGLFRGFGTFSTLPRVTTNRVVAIGSFPGQFIYYVGYEYSNAVYASHFTRLHPSLGTPHEEHP